MPIPNQVDDRQVLKGNEIVGLGIGVSDFVEQVLTLVLDMCVFTLDFQQRLAMVLAALLFPLQPALGKPQIALRLAIGSGRLDPLPLTVGQQVLDVQMTTGS